MSYYPNGAVKQFTYGNGIVHSMSQNARQLPQDVQSSGGVFHDRYAYDGNGNVSSILDVQDGGHLGWAMRNRYLSYDGLDRLTDAGSGSFGGDHWHRFTYDALDNMKSWKLAGVKDYAEYVYDAQNRLGSIKNSGGATVVGFGYDPQGNLQNKNGQMYSFDYGNRLREVAGTEWFYRYDGLGRRVLSGRADGITVSMYSQPGQLMYYEQTGKGNFEQIYLGGSLLAIRNSGVIKFQHTDALGSPIAVTDTAGAVIERNNYEPYGAIIGKPTYDAMGFTGHKQDGATGLTYMQQRYYDPTVGRFLSVDPVTALSSPVGMFNRYKYAANNPYRFVDPDGREERTRPGTESMLGHPGLGGNPIYVTGGTGNIPMHSLSRPTGEQAKTEHVWSGAMGVAQAISDGNTVKAEDEDNDGDNHCAELIKSSRTFGAAHTSNWSEGRPVQPGADIKPGTAIATFVDGKYPQVSDVKHAAVFIGFSPSGRGVMVLDQYEPGKNINYREIPYQYTGGNPHQNFVNSASNFSTVKW